MELPSFNKEQISTMVAMNARASTLFELLSQYEPNACLMSDDSGSPKTGPGDFELLSLYYSGFFFLHLLTNQM